MARHLVNGFPADTISLLDRGFTYGDGLFTTVLAVAGQARLRDRHLARLAHDCGRLGIPCPSADLLNNDIDNVLAATPTGVVRITVTRGSGARGYRPPAVADVTRTVSVGEIPANIREWRRTGIRLALCSTRLGRNPAIAGIKHLNRLEQVLASAELGSAGADDGVMLDSDGNVIEATRSNLFLVQRGMLRTPALAHSGVAGIMRALVIERAAALGVAVETGTLAPADLDAAEEVFVTNAVIGIWPVTALLAPWRRTLPIGPVTQSLINDPVVAAELI